MKGIESNIDPPLAVEKGKPSLFSAAWWTALFSALKLWKYSARDWAIWNLSSWATYATVFGLLKPLAAFVTAKVPWLMPALSAGWSMFVKGVLAVWAFLLALIAAIWNVSHP